MRDCEKDVARIMGLPESNFCLIASFPSRGIAEDSLKALSFASTENGELAFPASIQCGVFDRANGVMVVVGGALTESQVVEVKSAVAETGRIRQIRFKKWPSDSASAGLGSPRSTSGTRRWWGFWKQRR
jgi:hypothetical protein